MASDFNTGRDLHIDEVLSNIVVGRRPEGYVADQLLPITPVTKQSNIYYKMNHLQFRRYDKDLSQRAPGTEARKVHFSVSSDTYFAKNYALGADWPVEDEVNADEVLQWATQHAELVTDRLLIDYEIRVAGMANATTNIATTFSVATPWTNFTGSRPIDDIMNLKESFRVATGLKPNLMLYPEEVATKLRRSDQVRDILFGDRGGPIAADEQIANIVGIPKVLVPSILVNSAGDGETLIGSGEMHAAWARKLWLFYVQPLQGFKTDTWANAFRWTSPLFNVPWAIQRYPFDPKKKVYAIEASYYQDEKIVSSDLAWACDSVA